MAIFAVMADKANTRLSERIAELYPNDSYKLSDSEWLVSADSIPQNVAEQIGVRKGEFGRVIVMGATGSASGWHSKTVWEWLNQKRVGSE